MEREHNLLDSYVTAQENAFEKQREDWRTEIKNDPSMGGEKFKESVENAKRAVDRFGGEEFKDLLNETGYGDHPLVVKLLSSIGKAMADDKIVTGGDNSMAKSAGELFYPNMKD